MRRYLLLFTFSLIAVFSFSVLPAFASTSDTVDLSEYLVNFDEELTWEYANVECPTRERLTVNMAKISLVRPISINNYSAVYSVDFPRTTIQYANVTDANVIVMGRVYVTGLIQLDTLDWIYSDTRAISVSNNNQYGDVPRWTYDGEPLTFGFDLSGYDGHDIINFQIQFDFYNQRTDNERYTFYVRHQITDFYASPYDLADLGNQISGSINNQTDELLNATVDGFDTSMNNQQNAESQLQGGFSDLQGMVERPELVLDDLSSFGSSFVLIADGVEGLFDGLGGKFRIVWNSLVFFGGVALLLGLAVPVVGLASKSDKKDSYKNRKSRSGGDDA